MCIYTYFIHNMVIFIIIQQSRIFYSFKNILYFILEYSCLTMLCFTCIVGCFSYTCIYFKFFSHLGYYRILSRVPCVISQNFETKCLLLVTYDCVCVLVTQSCPAICFPTDYSLPGSSTHGILQARILEWVAIPFSRGSSNPGVEPGSPTLQADSSPSSHQGSFIIWLIMS